MQGRSCQRVSVRVLCQPVHVGAVSLALVVETEAAHNTRAEVLDHDVADRHQALRQRDALRLGQVYGGAQLVVAGWVFVIAMFAAGFLFAPLFRRFWS